ncbi:MAG: glycosyltransferase family 4 protein [Gammaproteobacteria bacterium]
MTYTILFLLSFFLSMAGGWWLIKNAKNLGMLKHPKGRDAHAKPVATSGGIFIIIPIVWAAMYLQLPWWLPFGLLLFSVMGMLDDRHDISFLKKFIIQAGFVFFVLYVYVALPPPRGVFSFLQYIFPNAEWVITNFILWMIFSVGFINFFNFMDGSDGHASFGALLLLFGAWFFSDPWSYMQQTTQQYFLLAVAGGLIGFLLWNRPRARIFMGDAGSLPLGFLLVAMMWLSSQMDARELGLWLILGAVFFTDSIVTIITLALRRQKFWLPHNVFAFQKVLRYFSGNHWAILLIHGGYSLFWLYPIAYFWQRYPEISYVWFLCAYAPIFFAILWLRAGFPDNKKSINRSGKKIGRF